MTLTPRGSADPANDKLASSTDPIGLRPGAEQGVVKMCFDTVHSIVRGRVAAEANAPWSPA